MNTKKIFLSALIGGLAVSAWADDAPGEQASGPGTMVGSAPSMPAGIMADALRGKVVRNAPFSAVSEQESQRTLADGNQITSKTSARYYRDSNGNTRHEVRLPGGDESITIRTADNTSYSLVPAAKLAIKISLDRINAKASAVGAATGTAIRARIEAQHKEGKPAAADARDGGEIVIKRAGPNDTAYADMLPFIAGAYGDLKWAVKAGIKELGAKNIDGVKAEGKLRSYEIPAGEVGNRNPIVVSDENWYSPELQVTLYSKHHDPRTGDIVYRLSSLKREEPPAALFTVPSDYTVKDVTEGPEKALGAMVDGK